MARAPAHSPLDPRPIAALSWIALAMLTACAPPQRCPPQVAPPPPAPQAGASAPKPPQERDKVAVLPLEDDHLFRAERAALRAMLADALAQRAPEYALLPFAEVDAATAPASPKTGSRCAFEDGSRADRARDHGWLTTDLMHVMGTAGRPEELWLTIGGEGAADVTFTSVWDSRLDRMTRYRAAFASMQRLDGGGGLLGGLAADGNHQGSAHAGPMTLCEERDFGACEPRSAAWSDRLGELASCYAGEDDVTNEVLLEATPAGVRCELTNVDDLSSRDGRREPCLCRSLAASAGIRAAAGRRVLRVHYEAPDLAGKPRPEARAVDVSSNLHADDDWRSMRSGPAEKPVYASVQRLALEDLDGLAAPLARCAAPAGAIVVAELAIAENGAVTGAHVVAASSDAPSACVEKALVRGAFDCTADGKPATVRVALTWPR